MFYYYNTGLQLKERMTLKKVTFTNTCVFNFLLFYFIFLLSNPSVLCYYKCQCVIASRIILLGVFIILLFARGDFRIILKNFAILKMA